MNKKRGILILIFLILILFIINYSWINSFAVRDDKEISKVLRIIDGDTVEVENNIKIRLLGINTPEKGEEYYYEAKNFLGLSILNKTIELKKGKEERDLYGRELRYLFSDGKNINLELVKKGFANPYFPSGKDEYYDEFFSAWDQCLIENKNLCKKSADICSSCIKIDFQHEKETVIIYNTCDFDCNLDKWSIKDEGRKKFIFDNFVLRKDKYVSIKTGSGIDNSANLYWNGYNYIWTETGDSLFLRDKNGELVLYANY